MSRTYDFKHWKALPKVSAQCITYGRPKLLAEAVESFLKQDYAGEKEMVILNDQPGVMIEFEHPEVKVYNRKTRYDTVGEKRTVCCKLTTGDVILPWDDDDISLPWRISTVLQEMKNLHYFKPKSYWTWQNNKIKGKPTYNVAHAMGGWSRALFNRVGGYKFMQSGQDTDFEQKVKAVKLKDCRDIPLRDLYYIYRFGGTGSYHLSAFGVNKGFTQAEAKVKGLMLKGIFKIEPFWKQDYLHMVKEIWSRIESKKK